MSLFPTRGYGVRRHEPSSPHGQLWERPHHDDRELQRALTTDHIKWENTPEAHIFKVALPGLRPEEVKVEVEEENRAIIITGEKKLVREERKGPSWFQMEQSTGRMVQRLSVPENAKLSQIEALMDKGVLKVIVPKHEVANYYNYARRPRITF